MTELTEEEREAIKCAAYAQDAWASDLSDHGYTTRNQRRYSKVLHALADRLSAIDSKKCPKCYGSQRVPDPDGYGLESLPCPSCVSRTARLTAEDREALERAEKLLLGDAYDCEDCDGTGEIDGRRYEVEQPNRACPYCADIRSVAARLRALAQEGGAR